MTQELSLGQPISGISTLSDMRERTPFGARLHEAMTHAKLSQPALAKAAGVSQGNLGELLWKGNGSMAVVRLAMACGVRPEWLAEGKGPMVDALSPDIAAAAAALQALPQRWREWALRHVWDTIETALESIQIEKNGIPQKDEPGTNSTNNHKRAG